MVHQSATKTWKMDGASSSSRYPNTTLFFFQRKMKWRRMHPYMKDLNDGSLATSEGTSENLFSSSFRPLPSNHHLHPLFCTHLIFVTRVIFIKKKIIKIFATETFSSQPSISRVLFFFLFFNFAISQCSCQDYLF